MVKRDSLTSTTRNHISSKYLLRTYKELGTVRQWIYLSCCCCFKTDQFFLYSGIEEGLVKELSNYVVDLNEENVRATTTLPGVFSFIQGGNIHIAV